MRWNILAGLGIAAAGIAIIARGVANSKRLTLTTHTVTIPDLPAAFEGWRLLFLTDLHIRRHSAAIPALLACAEAIDPDLICLGGDYAFTALSLADVDALLQTLTARWPVVGVLGNADYRKDVGPKVHARWRRRFPLLVNESLAIRRDDETLWIAGVNDPHKRFDDLPAALAEVPADASVLLLAHSAEIIQRPLDPRIRLILSGHTHGGQICLPGGKAIYHNTRLTAKFASGMHDVNGIPLYVSRGVGSTRFPLRYHCLPEITLFTLTRGGRQ